MSQAHALPDDDPGLTPQEIEEILSGRRDREDLGAQERAAGGLQALLSPARQAGDKAKADRETATLILYGIVTSAVIGAARRCGIREPRRNPNIEDIIQDVIFKAYWNFAKFDRARAPLRAWVYAIARNAVIDHVKQLKRWGRTIGDGAIEALAIRMSQDDDEPAGDFARVAQLEEAICHLIASGKLTKIDEEILGFLAEYDGDDWAKELADRLGTTPGRLRARKYRLTKRLHELMGVDQGHPGA